MSKTVFVSGATGFIAQHLVKQLLEKSYKVVGTVRSDAKGTHLANLFKSENFAYEVVPDIEPEGAFDEALKKHPETAVFLHTASPFHFKATDQEKELLKPAVNGTRNALKAIKEFGPNVKKVVITSSYAAVGTAEKELDPNHTNTEESWNEISWEDAKRDPVSGYRGSKKFGEKAAWDFVAAEKPNFDINYINPGFVFGPQAFDSEVKDNLNTSSEILNQFLKLKPDSPIPATKGGYADVRDVARAHIIAFEKDLKNQRLIMHAGRFSSQDILDILNKRFDSLRGKIPVGEPGTGKKAYENLCTIDNSKTKQILGFELMGLEETVYDSVKQILDAKSKL